jgi:hypothetical protein
MLSESKRAAILELQKRGHGIRQIARTLYTTPLPLAATRQFGKQ